MADSDKTTGVSFQCTPAQRESYIKAANGGKLGAWICKVLDAHVRNLKAEKSNKPKTNQVKPSTGIDDIDEDYDNRGNR